MGAEDMMSFNFYPLASRPWAVSCHSVLAASAALDPWASFPLPFFLSPASPPSPPPLSPPSPPPLALSLQNTEDERVWRVGWMVTSPKWQKHRTGWVGDARRCVTKSSWGPAPRVPSVGSTNRGHSCFRKLSLVAAMGKAGREGPGLEAEMLLWEPT